MIARMEPLCSRAHGEGRSRWSNFLYYTIRGRTPSSADRVVVISSSSSLGLTPTCLAQVFPFHLVLDRQGRVLQTGRVLRRLCPQLAEGSRAEASIRIRDPKIALDYRAICARASEAFILEIVSSGLRLRGQMIE